MSTKKKSPVDHGRAPFRLPKKRAMPQRLQSITVTITRRFGGGARLATATPSGGSLGIRVTLSDAYEDSVVPTLRNAALLINDDDLALYAAQRLARRLGWPSAQATQYETAPGAYKFFYGQSGRQCHLGLTKSDFAAIRRAQPAIRE